MVDFELSQKLFQNEFMKKVVHAPGNEARATKPWFLENAYNIVGNNNILHNLVSIKALVGNKCNSTRTGGLLHCLHEIPLFDKPPPKVSQCQLNRDIRHYYC